MGVSEHAIQGGLIHNLPDSSVKESWLLSLVLFSNAGSPKNTLRGFAGPFAMAISKQSGQHAQTSSTCQHTCSTSTIFRCA